MSRTLSAGAVSQLVRQHTATVFLVLADISHPDMTTVRLVNNTEGVTSGGNSYLGFPFQFVLPEDKEGELKPTTMTISNVDRRLVDELRTIEGPLNMVIKVVTSTAPSTVEIGPLNFKLGVVDISRDVITGTLTYEPTLGTGFPSGTFNPQTFPALFGIL